MRTPSPHLENHEAALGAVEAPTSFAEGGNLNTANPEAGKHINESVTMIGRIDQAHPAVVYGFLAALLAAVFAPMSLFSLVDGAEGTYLLQPRLVADGS